MNRIFIDDFKVLRKSYLATKFPIVLCHGLMGFDSYTLPNGKVVEYFRGIRDALGKRGAQVQVMPVPPMAIVELRAQTLYQAMLKNKVIRDAKRVNIIAHSMGGLDSRYLLKKLLKPSDPIQVASLTTLSTPHRGSPIADLFESITRYLPADLGAFYQLATGYMKNKFNPEIDDNKDVEYFSYGARVIPSTVSPFYLSASIIEKTEGENDGMVSVESAKWGKYMGTMDNVDHADIINMNTKPQAYRNTNFSAEAMYLHIMNDLAKLGF